MHVSEDDPPAARARAVRRRRPHPLRLRRARHLRAVLERDLASAQIDRDAHDVAGHARREPRAAAGAPGARDAPPVDDVDGSRRGVDDPRRAVRRAAPLCRRADDDARATALRLVPDADVPAVRACLEADVGEGAAGEGDIVKDVRGSESNCEQDSRGM